MTHPVVQPHIMILTGEPSGDMHGANLVRQIKQIRPEIMVSGIGGPALKKEKVNLFYPIEKLSVMGFTEVLMQFKEIKQAFDLFRQKLRTHPPNLIILIDYPGFNLKAANYAKTHSSAKILYYITPKVWAWKKSRLKKIKAYVDHAALILPFEEQLFKKYNIDSTYVGNPLMDQYPEVLCKPFLRHNQRNLPPKKQTLVVGLLPGSRKTEVKNLGSVMEGAALLLKEKFSNITFLISKAGSIDESLLKTYLNLSNISSTIHTGQVKDIFIQSDLVIAASGTVTLEAALCCVPTIIVYKVSHISFRIAKLLVKIKYAGLANLIMNQEVMPELIQYDATPEKIAQKAGHILQNLKFYEDRLAGVRKRLGLPGASVRTARIALNMIRK